MKFYISLVVLFVGISSSWAQEDDISIPKEKRAEIESKKIGYLTAKLELSPEEAQKFWPVYNEFQSAIDSHRQEGVEKIRYLRQNISTMDSEEILERLRYRFTHEQERVEIEEEYFEKLAGVLPARKLAILYQAEKDFKRELLRRVVDDRRRLMEQRRERFNEESR